MIKTSKAFHTAGWARVGGTMLKSMGSALIAYVFTGAATLGTWRIRIGSRVSVLERRAHGTPTGRCSRGHWERMDDAPTPQRAAEWSKLGKFWAFAVETHGTTPGPWQTHFSGDVQRCATRAASDGGAGSMAGARGRVCKSNPTRFKAFGYAPATGVNLGTHDPGRIKALQRTRRMARASKRFEAIKAASRVVSYQRGACSGHGPCEPGLRCWNHEQEAS
jgi:hypothetical protein